MVLECESQKVRRVLAPRFLDAVQSKYGAPARSERTCNYNQLLGLEEELGAKAEYSSVL